MANSNTSSRSIRSSSSSSRMSKKNVNRIEVKESKRTVRGNSTRDMSSRNKPLNIKVNGMKNDVSSQRSMRRANSVRRSGNSPKTTPRSSHASGRSPRGGGRSPRGGGRSPRTGGRSPRTGDRSPRTGKLSNPSPRLSSGRSSRALKRSGSRSLDRSKTERLNRSDRQISRRATSERGRRERPRPKETSTRRMSSRAPSSRRNVKSQRSVKSLRSNTSAHSMQAKKPSARQVNEEEINNLDDATIFEEQTRVKKPSLMTRFTRWLFPSQAGAVYLQGDAADAAELLQLSQRQLQHLMMSFQDIDSDGSGKIDYNEFFHYIEEPRSAFSDALFRMIDLDHSGTIDFNEYVQILTTYCMYTKEDILLFAFGTFDADNNGTIDEHEFTRLCVDINNGNPSFPGNFLRALEEFDRNGDGLIDFEEFRELNRRYPLMIFPAFRMQDRMQKATLGEKGWIKIARMKAREAYVEEYRRTHKGRLPPEPLLKRLFGCFRKRRRNNTRKTFVDNGE